jgi:hypothetical protein
MALMLNHEPTKYLCVGKSGCGKTIKANRIILESNYAFYFIFDHDGQFAARNKIRPAMTRQALLPMVARGFAVFNPTECFDDTKAALDWFCRYAYLMSEKLRGTKLFYCDEIQDIIGTNTIPQYVRKVLVSGRNRGLDFLACSLQYNMIHNSIRGQATKTIAFHTDEQAALKPLSERGFNADEIVALKPGQYIALDHRHGNKEERGRVF